MQSQTALRVETLGGQSPAPSPAQVTPFPPSTAEPERAWVKGVLTKERIEEAVGVVFITTTLFLTGWFYYLLYRALQH
jgi:hypothetical protein